MPHPWGCARKIGTTPFIVKVCPLRRPKMVPSADCVLTVPTALARSDGVIMCGGLGPTQDDITREAIAEVMNVPLVRDQAIVDHIAAFFRARGREMSENNARQADVPQGAAVIAQTAGTAPGLICPVGNKVVYAVPGVPYEMAEMFESIA